MRIPWISIGLIGIGWWLAQRKKDTHPLSFVVIGDSHIQGMFGTTLQTILGANYRKGESGTTHKNWSPADVPLSDVAIVGFGSNYKDGKNVDTQGVKAFVLALNRKVFWIGAPPSTHSDVHVESINLALASALHGTGARFIDPTKLVGTEILNSGGLHMNHNGAVLLASKVATIITNEA